MVTVKAKSRSEMTTGSCVMELRADCNAAGAETTPGDRTRLSSGPGGPGERMCAACGHQSCLHDQPQKQPLLGEGAPTFPWLSTSAFFWEKQPTNPQTHT